MCGCATYFWPLPFQDRHTGVFSWAIPMSTPLTAIAFSGLDQWTGISSLISPLAKRRTGIPFAFAHRYTLATYTSPILPNAAA